MGKWTRRGFIGVGGLLGGGLLLGVGEVLLAPNRLSVKGPEAGPSQIATWLRITPDNIVTVLVPHAEMGQGAHTALAQMLADELDADWNLVRVAEAPAEDAYANEYMVQTFMLGGDPPALIHRGADFAALELTKFVGLQITGGSASVRATGRYGMRVAGAAGRTMLIEAAAQSWGVPASECTADLSYVHHAASGRSQPFGALAGAASTLPIPEQPVLKTQAEWKIMGKSIPRMDLPPKVNGTAVYGIDMVLPGMLYATVRAAPVFGTKLLSCDPAPAMAMPGVKAVIPLADAVAVVADGYWHALQAVRALHPVFAESPHDAVDSAHLAAQLSSLLDASHGSQQRATGDGLPALDGAKQVVEARYAVPYLAHATLEPPNATVRFAADGSCEVWTGVQDPLNARGVAADAAGLSHAKVTLHNLAVGGGFGRKLPWALDFIDQAVRIAKAMSPTPVKTLWSREEDIQHDFYRPLSTMHLRGGLDGQGQPIAWAAHYAGGDGNDAVRIPYAIANQYVGNSKPDSHVRIGSWRAVEFGYHGFFTESFIDELAVAAGKDPFAFRRDLLPAGGRHRAVLERAAFLAGWGAPMPPGEGLGIALVEAFGSIVAEVAHVQITADGAPKLLKLVAVVDCGDLVNPDTAAAQVEGGILFGLSAALYGEVTIEKGAVAQRNFYDYKVARMKDSPEILVDFITSHAPMGGMGEVGVPPLAPAMANAIYAITGQRLRTLPFTGQHLSALHKA